MKILSLKFYEDPSHGWLAVKRKLLEELTIMTQITSYSYQRGDTVYLEEDQDAQVFVNAAKEAGWKLEFTTKHTNGSSPIRSYESFEALFHERRYEYEKKSQFTFEF